VTGRQLSWSASSHTALLHAPGRRAQAQLLQRCARRSVVCRVHAAPMRLSERWVPRHVGHAPSVVASAALPRPQRSAQRHNVTIQRAAADCGGLRPLRSHQRGCSRGRHQSREHPDRRHCGRAVRQFRKRTDGRDSHRRRRGGEVVKSKMPSEARRPPLPKRQASERVSVPPVRPISGPSYTRLRTAASPTACDV